MLELRMLCVDVGCNDGKVSLLVSMCVVFAL
jgi:hypothetical protein